ncbi:hypothetical protein [Actinoplanes sp. NBRC 101535]|uniref:hypothetical protein n=1 Tax=Actinoplanes sp. NBRC 101535 TaxID=3032196 RepID=UPI0024A0E852|nr:hypothetical protein [Actinoplanes sp. NBRC 101535]GLY08240.1 hypothetical protein Acsp01_86190 [Actinoplanes sp. NBRC 101535]
MLDDQPTTPADAETCFLRAQRSLEQSEIILDATCEELGTDGRARVKDGIAYGDARARLGHAWAALGAARQTPIVWATDGPAEAEPVPGPARPGRKPPLDAVENKIRMALIAEFPYMADNPGHVGRLAAIAARAAMPQALTIAAVEVESKGGNAQDINTLIELAQTFQARSARSRPATA